MATFTIAPSISTQLTVRPRTKKVQFGDGYEQRFSMGLNTRSEQWDLTFHCKGATERDAVLDFFEARNGQESFDWTTPNGDAKKFVCEEWRQRQEGDNFFVIDTSFREVHEP
jgi:phage-related protein